MNTIDIEASRCPRNHFCPVINVCPSGAISQKDPYSAPEIDEDKCTVCGKCTISCGHKAFYIKKIL